MLATDLGSRGLDFPFLEVVVNYDFPSTTSDYLHRAGRTGRAGRQGTVYTLYHNKNIQAINEFKKSNDTKKPLDVRRSAYSLINKEEFKHLRKPPKTAKPVQKARKATKPHKTVRFRQKIKIKRRNNDWYVNCCLYWYYIRCSVLKIGCPAKISRGLGSCIQTRSRCSSRKHPLQNWASWKRAGTSTSYDSFLIQKSTTISSLQAIIRNRLGLKETEAIFIFAYKTLLHVNEKIGDLYKKFESKAK